METRKQIEKILLDDYGCFDDFTVDKLCDLSDVIISRLLSLQRLDIDTQYNGDFTEKDERIEEVKI